MSSENSKHLFNNKEHIYVRRLISVLTNDDSDKLIVEKLKGKNLSSLLYNAKVIDNSKNMAANKRILGCVIRAIEKEKHLCRRRELDQSWGRKLLSSFNCLNPVKPIDELSELSIRKSCTVHSRNMNRKEHKHQELAKRRQNQSVRSESKPVGKKRSGVSSPTVSERKDSQNSVQNNVEVSDMLQEQSISSKCTFLVQKKIYETVCPPNLGAHQPKYVKYVYVDSMKKVKPTRPQTTHPVDKKTSSTQTFKFDDSAEKEQTANPSNIRLQDLLEAATGLINTRDQKEYVKSFLSNFEPPFDLTSGFPPYLKLPMKPVDDIINKESVYGSNSEMSVVSGRISPRMFESSGGELYRQKEDHVKKYVRELNDPWQEAAESIISGVINETLPHDKADYSQLGACILKRLGAYPNSGFKDQRISRMNTTVPEIVLSCTEWFESGTGESDKKSEKSKENCDKTKIPCKTKTQHKLAQPVKIPSAESIEDIKLLEDESDHSKVSWERQRLQNYCFYDGSASKAKVGLLDVSEGSIGDIGMKWEEVHEVTRDGDHVSQDRIHFPRLEPLTISPSVLDQVNRKDKTAHKKNGVDTVRWFDSHVNKNRNCVQDKKTVSKEKISCKANREVVQNASKPSYEGDSNLGNVETAVEENVSATVANLSAFLPEEAQKEEPAVTTYVSTPGNEDQTSPETVPWEPTVAEVETFDGIGECHSKVTDVTKIIKSPSDKKLCNGKTRARSSLQDKFRGKKKCKNQGKTKKGGKGEVDITRSCKVM